MRDVVVVGAGPIGTAAARHLAAAGFSVLVVEEHPTIGEPVQCAGLFTPRVFDLVPAEASRLQRNRIRRAHVYSPSGARLELEHAEVHAIATDRGGFDRLMAGLAESAGAELQTGTKCVGLERDANGAALRLRSAAGERTERARLVIGADGAQSRVAKWAGLFEPRQFVSLHGAEMSGLSELDPEGVEMWLGRDVAPGFFGYIVPTGADSGKVEVGVWNAPRPARTYFERLARHPVAARHLGDAKIQYVVSAVIPVGPARRSVADRVALVGDAAGQAKPTSGGGVYTGLRCVEHLAPVAIRALETGDCSARALQPYHDAWRGDIGRELWLGTKLRHAFLSLSDRDMDELWRVLGRDEVLAILNRHGDIDYPSRVAFALLRRAPGLLRYAPKAVHAFFTAPA